MKFNKGMLKTIGMRAAGAAAGGGAAYGIDKMLPNLNQKTRALIKTAAGILLPELAPKNKVLGEAGTALAAVGLFQAAQIFLSGGTGVQGVGDPEYTVGDSEYSVTGDGDYNVSGDNDALGETNDALGDTEY